MGISRDGDSVEKIVIGIGDIDRYLRISEIVIETGISTDIHGY